MEAGQKVNSLEETYELGHYMACRISNIYYYASNNQLFDKYDKLSFHLIYSLVLTWLRLQSMVVTQNKMVVTYHCGNGLEIYQLSSLS